MSVLSLSAGRRPGIASVWPLTDKPADLDRQVRKPGARFKLVRHTRHFSTGSGTVRWFRIG
ncbi:hypothetical protein ABW16_15505 [Mycolicibacter heraklionensis]|uniref:Uncharacterized protein n=1 Tax=Mycolicibacter heraklionensis TaxID=512402 RepID=A0ABR5FD70_9MYCO|nr:hypothetical protein ABW16_15505 [Mycolicibacter heraklionensis]